MPETYRLIFAPAFLDDLTQIHQFIAEHSPANAGRVAERILNSVESLQGLPHRTVIERQNPHLRFPVRTLPVRPYIVYFRVNDQEKAVLLLRVQHGARRRPRDV